MLVVGLALAPLALASIIQAVLNFHAYQRETDRILVQTALYAAYNEQNLFTRAEQVLRSLARKPELTDTPQECWTTLSDALAGAMPIVNLTRVDASGRVICMGAVAPPKPVYAKLRWWPALRSADRVIIGDQFFSQILHRSILPLAYPIHGKGGAFVGALSASVDLHWLETAPQISKLPTGTVSLIMDAGGHVLASNRPIPDGMAQSIIQQARGARRQVFAAAAENNERWRWVAEPIGISDKFVAFGIPEPKLFATFRSYLFADVLLTILIVFATCAAIWLGTEWLVVRWTIYLKRVAVAYGRNHFALSLEDMNSAPDEFRLLGHEMKRMAGAIQERDHTLNDALKKQYAMTRETHHRVKNNLQIVSSLVNIYAQTVASPIAKSAFRQIMARIDALTLIQRLIEGSEAEPTVNMTALLEQFADQMRALAAEHGQQFRLKLDIEHRYLSPDIATPIILFAIEALAFDIFMTKPEMHWRDVRLAFSSSERGYLLVIEDGCPGALPIGVPNPDRIMRSLADQLRGRYAVEALEGGGCRITLRLPLDVTLQQEEPAAELAANIYAFDVSRTRHA
jgi:two-component sensor histidine kinase